MKPSLQKHLEHLQELILQERECAKQLDLVALDKIVAQKSELLAGLQDLTSEQIGAELQPLATSIHKENQRNAYLFWSSLTWIRETIDFFNQQIADPTYGAGGNSVSNGHSGTLLSGKV